MLYESCLPSYNSSYRNLGRDQQTQDIQKCTKSLQNLDSCNQEFDVSSNEKA